MRVFNKQRRCQCKNGGTAGYYVIAAGIGIFIAYAIPRYILIILLGCALIGAGFCILKK